MASIEELKAVLMDAHTQIEQEVEPALNASLENLRHLYGQIARAVEGSSNEVFLAAMEAWAQLIRDFESAQMMVPVVLRNLSTYEAGL
jgi:hypothetical protein